MIEENQTEKDRREKVARGSKLPRHIKIIDLMDIMAEDENYTDILPALKKEFFTSDWVLPREYIGEDSANEEDPKWIEPDDLLETPKGRVYYWLNLIRRWSGLQADATKERLDDIPIGYLDRYRHDRKTGKYENIDLEEETPDHIRDINRLIRHFTSLDGFEKYLKAVEEYIGQMSYSQ